MTKYRAEVLIEVELDDTGDENTDFQAAFEQVDTVLQRAWDTDQGRHHVRKWHFEIPDDAVTVVEEPEELQR